MNNIIDFVLAGKVKPVVGKVIAFDDIPAEIEAMGNRQTVGRTVVILDGT